MSAAGNEMHQHWRCRHCGDEGHRVQPDLCPSCNSPDIVSLPDEKF